MNQILATDLLDDEDRVIAGVTITDHSIPGVSQFVLQCTDYVANVWQEVYPELHQCLARTAVLAHIVRNDTCSFFKYSNKGFQPVAEAWLSEQYSCRACAESQE